MSSPGARAGEAETFARSVSICTFPPEELVLMFVLINLQHL